MKKLQLGIIAILIIWIVAILTGCGSLQTPAQEYQSKIASKVEYTAWSKRHSPMFGHKNASLKRAEDYLSQSKKAKRKSIKSENLELKIARINAKAESLNR